MSAMALEACRQNVQDKVLVALRSSESPCITLSDSSLRVPLGHDAPIEFELLSNSIRPLAGRQASDAVFGRVYFTAMLKHETSVEQMGQISNLLRTIKQFLVSSGYRRVKITKRLAKFSAKTETYGQLFVKVTFHSPLDVAFRYHIHWTATLNQRS